MQKVHLCRPLQIEEHHSPMIAGLLLCDPFPMQICVPTLAVLETNDVALSGGK